ncbi:Separin [Pseudocercospora fuligena]|uniref:separase n=1 Tax=Pseudocercospora fuligena TaxID=685502 RepID=A0A8H6RTN6_9PEZI|nr:Separin [Pseudocercospora fuligena]
MATTNDLARAVKEAISAGRATSATVSTLQTLLGTAPASPKPGSQQGTSGTSTRATRPPTSTSRTSTRTAKTSKATTVAKVATTSSTKKATVQVHEDASRLLAPKERYALATEIVNISLKVLTDAAKPHPRTDHATAHSVSSTPQRSSRTQCAADRALQVRAGNATPVKVANLKSKDDLCSPAKPTEHGLSRNAIDWTATAECSRLAFSHLRSVNPDKLGVKGLPKLQLEKGMLALAGKLSLLHLDNLAAKELHAAKKRFLGPHSADQHKEAFSSKTGEKDSLASLLQVDIDPQASAELLPLLITYHTHLLNIIAKLHKPAVVEEALQYLQLDSPSSPCDIIIAQYRVDEDQTKAIRHLENLYYAVIRLCPSASSSKDDVACSRTKSPSPLSAFKLQTLALRIRQQLWNIAGHKVDLGKDIVEPFNKALGTFMRRSSTIVDVTEAYKVCSDSLVELGLATHNETNSTMSTVTRILSTLAERAGLIDQSLAHADHARELCSGLGKRHARYLAALTRTLCLRSRESLSRGTASDLHVIEQGLLQSLSGSGSDYEMLLTELDRLISSISKDCDEEVRDRLQSLARASGAFASRFAKCCPDKQAKTVTDLLAIALFHSKSNEDLASWMSQDTIKALLQSGALKTVCEKAATQPAPRAWSSTTTVLALSRALKGLVLRSLASGSVNESSMPFDEENLAPDERGTLFEWQLRCAIDVAQKPKYQTALAKLIPTALRELSQLYTSTSFPIRRARVAALALHVREQYPHLLAPHTLQVFKNAEVFDENFLGGDQGLHSYALDVKTSIAVSRALRQGPEASCTLKTHLAVWQTLIHEARDAKTLEACIESPATLLVQLIAAYDYFSMLADDEARLPVARMIMQIELLWGADGTRWLNSLVRSASSYLYLGYAEKAGELFETAGKAVEGHETLGLEALECQVHQAEYFLAIDRLEDCQASLQTAARAREVLQPKTIRQQQSTAYKLLHVRAWLLRSKYLLAKGNADGALVSAKRAVKVVNGIWAALERKDPVTDRYSVEDPQETTETIRRPVDSLIRGVSKLNLKHCAEESAGAAHEPRGAAFWPVVRLMCDTIMHLCDMFVRHGVFNEADCASEKAMKIASTAGDCELLSRVRSHRSIFLAAAGKVEEAELCLARDQENGTTLSLLAKLGRLRARAAIALKHKDTQDALRCLSEAENLINDTPHEGRLSQLELLATAGQESHIAEPSTRGVKQPAKSKPASAAKGSSSAPKGILKKSKAANVTTSNKTGPRSVQHAVLSGSFYMMQKLGFEVSCHRVVMCYKLGFESSTDLAKVAELCKDFPSESARCLIGYAVAMRKASRALQSDFSFNVLPESTLSFPAIQLPDRRLSAFNAVVSPAPKAAKSVKIAKVTSKSPVVDESLGRLLLQARHCIDVKSLQSRAISTSEAHVLYCMLSDASLLLSATSATEAAKALHPVQEAMSIELARIYATECQLTVAKLDVDVKQVSDLLAWPQPEAKAKPALLTTRSFKQDYVDVLPKPWTAVSLSLNETCDELYIVRYRHGQPPLVLRLPFSRHRSEESDEDQFDFNAGKAELQQIIQLSNYSCHNSMDTSIRGAKTNWWSEREALDKRLQELLMNMENLWLGGFKGVFSQHEHNSELVNKFRTALDSVLARHLPSRRPGNKGSSKLALDDQVLELIIGLGHDKNGDIDLDEALQDLLYFVVDILQFNGECNAYDEIDLDSMAIEVLDALRDYHDAADSISDSAHLTLILDRRLQAFPWESLPCLENASVSRVDSMLTLRERLTQMRSQGAATGEYTVSRRSGSYVLNPSGDLKSTQAALSPELEKLAVRAGHTWKSFVNQVPTEEDFKSALTTSSSLLYFGHGAGSQYIRPRAIRKLEKCSEVVWLMGCSSGAVTEYDELEPFAVPLAYMQAGDRGDSAHEVNEELCHSKCMAVVATLWDVTDKDIDRFSLAVGEEWGLWSPPTEATALPAKTPRKQRRAVAAPSTPDKSIVAPKTPKVKKTPAPARTPARSRSRARGTGPVKKQSLVQAVARSRDACYLRYLNGAAPVVFGVPVYLDD